jgi:glycerol uptake facilitator-like aquaporin
VREPSLVRRLLAETLGTLILVATVVGSGIMAERLAGGNVALALLGNTLPTGAILVVLITILGPVSGAHFNPAVSAVFAARGDIGVAEAGLYALCQIVGGIFGTILAHAMFDLPLLATGITARGGTGQWIGEIVATFSLILVILGGLRHAPDKIPLLVGLTITAAYWFTSSTSFANPAVTIARALTPSFAGIAHNDVLAFVIAQGIGASAGMALAALLFVKSNDPA